MCVCDVCVVCVYMYICLLVIDFALSFLSFFFHKHFTGGKHRWACSYTVFSLSVALFLIMHAFLFACKCVCVFDCLYVCLQVCVSVCTAVVYVCIVMIKFVSTIIHFFILSWCLQWTCSTHYSGWVSVSMLQKCHHSLCVDAFVHVCLMCVVCLCVCILYVCDFSAMSFGDQTCSTVIYLLLFSITFAMNYLFNTTGCKYQWACSQNLIEIAYNYACNLSLFVCVYSVSPSVCVCFSSCMCIGDCLCQQSYTFLSFIIICNKLHI